MKLTFVVFKGLVEAPGQREDAGLFNRVRSVALPKLRRGISDTRTGLTISGDEENPTD